MRSMLLTKSRRSQAICVGLVAALTLAAARPVNAQYYYQPAPDYYHNDTASGTFMGGALGVLIAMYRKRHKTRHTSFRIGIPLLLLLNILLYGYFLS